VSKLAEQRDKQTEGTIVQSEYSGIPERTGAEAANQNLTDWKGTRSKRDENTSRKVDSIELRPY
jgi:hypothetical protein